MIKHLQKVIISIVTTVISLLIIVTANAQTGPAGVNAGIVLWLDAGNVNNTFPSTNPVNNTAVTTWRDISGNNNNATVLAGQNTAVINTNQINGKDVMKFTRTSQILGTVYNVAGVDIRAVSKPRITIFTVYRNGAKTNNAAEQHGIWGDDNGAWDRFFMPSFFSDNGVVSVGPPTNNVSVTNSGITGNIKLLTAVYDNGAANGSTIYLNGLTVQTVTDNTDANAAQSTLRIGWDGDDNAFNGDIAEMIVYNRKLTDCEIKAVNRYLGYKYGVTFTTASITPAPAATFCTGGNSLLTSSTGTAYQWLLNNAPIGGATFPTYTATAPGNYQVAVTNSGCLDTSAITAVKEQYARVYVDSSVAVSGTGASWASPLKTLSEALDRANSVTCATNIWVKKGTYYPMLSGWLSITSSRDSAFRILRNNIKVYGGFAGTETLLSQRNITANTTILSGDINIAGNATDNVYHVFTIVGNAANNINNATTVDGFTIRDGANNGAGSFTVNGTTINQTDGGAILLAGNGAGNVCSPLIENNIFTGNAGTFGSGIYCFSQTGGVSSPAITNCSFTSNNATSGAGLSGYGSNSNPVLTNCTFTSNNATNVGGAVAMNGTAGVSSPVFTGCIFTGNSSGGSGGAVIITGVAATPSSAQFINCKFLSNTANPAGAQGGGIYSSVVDVIISGTTFSLNRAWQGGGMSLNGATASLTNDSLTYNTVGDWGGGALLSNVAAVLNNVTCLADTARFAGAMMINGGTATATSCKFLYNRGYGGGGGFYVRAAATSTLNYCLFQSNVCTASDNILGSGGGFQSESTALTTMNNCVFADNVAGGTGDDGGGAIMMYFGSVNLNDVTFSGNATASTGKPNGNTLSLNGGTTTVINNSIVWGVATNQVSPLGTLTLNYSDVKGIPAAGTNLSVDPSFINASDPDGADNIWGTADDGLNLAACAPPVNRGSNALIPAGIATDFKSDARIQQVNVDMGAYESNLTLAIAHVDGTVATSGTGISWASPFKTVTQALDAANAGPCVSEIWVKAGTYYPMNSDLVTVATSRDSSFRILRNGIKLYGGFAGTETLLSQRNIAANTTILSGDIGVLNDSLDNVSHVVTIVSQPTDNINTTTVVSGFTITRANANIVNTTTINGIYSQRGDGGGIACIGSGAGNNCSPKIDSCIITNNYANVGGALYCGAYTGGSASPVITDCTIKNNNSINVGGIHAYGSGGVTSPVITRCLFLNNTTLNNGGAIGLFNASGSGTITPQAINCFFYGNRAATAGGVLNIFNGPGTFTLTNAVFANNSTTGTGGGGGVIHVAANGTVIFNDCTLNENITTSTSNPNSNSFLNDVNGTISFNNSIVWGTAALQVVNNGTANYNYSDIRGIAAAGTNLNITPEFINPSNPIGPDNIWGTADDGLNLVVCSPVANKGSNALIPAGITTDVKNTARIQQTTVDMGAYESNLTTLVAYVDGSVAVNGNGTSWASPFKTLTQALNVANFTNCVNEIWVKAGTYYPMAGVTTVAASRDSSFRILRNGIKVYGGFAGTETLLSQRNVTANVTTLSGDIGVAGNATDNVYHVFTIVGTAAGNINNTTTVDGFTIRAGANNGAGAFTVNGTTMNRSDGGAMLLAGSGAGNNCSPLIQNNIFTNNAGTFGSGIYCHSQTGGVSNPVITNCSFISNTATGGAALAAYGSNSSPVLTNCTFTSNASTAGAGAVDMNGTAGVVSPVFTSCRFTDNSATGNGGAASNTGVAVTPSSPQYINCTFTGNRSTGQGAGIYAGTVTLSVTGSVITTGAANGGGGGIFANASTLTLDADTVSYNSVPVGGGGGGGIYLSNSTASLTNSLILGDTASFGAGVYPAGAAAVLNTSDTKFIGNYSGVGVNSGGGAIYNNGGTTNALNCIFYNNTALGGPQGTGAGYQQGSAPSTGTISNSVFANNKSLGANDDGGGAIMNYGGTLTFNDVTFSENITASTTKPNANTISTFAGTTTVLNNCIIWGAAANQVYNLGTLTLNYSDVKGIPAAGTNLSVDPLFINATDPDGGDNIWGTADDGLKLIDCSKAINTGSNALIPGTVTGDITTGPRIIQAIVDMGAYENTYVIPPTQTVSIVASQNPICANGSVTFTATPVNGGTTPAYQWQVNGVNAGTNASTFTTTTLVNGDIVMVILTSSLVCVLPPTTTSNSITMNVVTNLTPAVSLAITSGAQTICAGTSVTFTATPTNGGTTPAYQWQVNGVNAGTNASTFTSTTLANNDVVTVIMTSNFACVSSNNPTSNGITMTVNPNLTPTVSIVVSQNPICAGTSVTFTATPVNGGTTPIYQWKVNGINAGTNSPTFTSTTLANGDVVTVVMTSNFNCLASNNPVSNAITMTVNPNLTPSVSIAITTGAQTICAGTSVTFTATPVNGGTTPIYQWQVNGINAGTNSPTFTTTTLANGDVVTVIMTSNFNCLASNNPVSNSITMTVGANLTPAVSIAITSGAQTICAGTSVTFTATPTNGGTAPAYQWQVNGVNAGTNAPTFTSTTLANNDVVTVIMTSNFTCLASNNPTSNGITMTVNPNLTPSVSIVVSQNPICAGTSVTFTATPTNGGTTPIFQWKVNGINAGTNLPTFTSTTLANGDVITVVMTSNFNCLASNNPTSNAITMTVNPNLTPAVSIAITTGAQTICAGTSVTFTATPTNGGSAPAYQWQVNGINSGTNAATFTSTTLANGDVVTVILTSNETCLASNNPTSNSITMTVNPNLSPAVSIAITNGAQIICAGTSVTFTATPTNGGSAPAYQWKVNGINAGTNTPTFTTTTLANNDVVTVVLTSNETCLASNNPTSNSITMTVNPNLTPSVSIAASQTTICQNASVTFTATPTNGGTSPMYQWKINGSNAGGNSPTFSVSTLSNGDVVTVVMTSNFTCLASNNPVSNGIAITVNPNLTPTISIAIPNSTVCAGAFAQFTATITNGGPTPTYQWKVNGSNVGNNSPTFASATLASGDIVSCILTTSIPCHTALNVASNNIVVTIAPIPVVTLTGVTEILQGGYAQLNSLVSVPNVTYDWTPAGSLNNPAIPNPIASPDNTTIYKLEATSAANCKGSATITVKVVQGPQIANTFTPNNDGIHDFWEIKNLFTYPNCRIQVFTRTGQLVFESIGYRKPWDGNYKGKALPFDTYYYILELNNRVGGKPITGYVTIVK